jgi:hypothetical protein
MNAPIFAPPSEEGARLALEELFERPGAIEILPRCAVVIDVNDPQGTLVQRAIAHADVAREIKRAFAEMIDRNVTHFADAQLLDRIPRGQASPYRGGAVPTNDFAGFDCGFAAATARDRVLRLRDSLRSAAELDVRLYVVPFLLYERARDGDVERIVIMRREDGTYVFEDVG